MHCILLFFFWVLSIRKNLLDCEQRNYQWMQLPPFSIKVYLVRFIGISIIYIFFNKVR